MSMLHTLCHGGRWLVLIAFLCLVAAVWGAAPEWVDDPGNSRWIVFGGETGISDSQGITLRDKTGEGDLTTATYAGVSCGRSLVQNGGAGFFYLIAEPWDKLSAWLGEDHGLLLTIRYYDGAPGTMTINYDSSDPRVKNDPYPAGVWRHPDEYPQGVKLDGSKTWKTLKIRLQLAYFAKRCHAADIRLDPHIADFGLAGVALTRIERGEDPGMIVKQELRVDKATGITSFGKGARFVGAFMQDGDKPIVLEGEQATTLSLANGHSPGIDAQASGGGYIHFVDNASWKITVKTPGRYIAWERGLFPWAGGWNHEESLENGTQGGIVLDSTGTPKPGWQWVKGREFNLTAGEHTFRMSYCGGARLDMVVLSREDTPPDLTRLTSSYQGPASGEIWTTPVKPFDVAMWKSVTFDLPAGAEYQISTDGGKTWAPFDAKGDLSTIKSLGGGKDSVQFHITLNAAGGVPPLFGGGAIFYQAGPNNVKVVENARLKMEIDPYGVKSIFDKKSNSYVCKAGMFHDPLAMLVVKKPGPAQISSQDLFNSTLERAEMGGTADTPVLTMSHLLANGIRLVTTATLLPNGQSTWQLKIENPTDLEVAEVRFPLFNGCKLGEKADDDWMFMPKYWGQVWQNPAASKNIGAFWGPSMRCAMLWDDTAGLYFGIEDPKFEDYAIVYGGDSTGGLTLGASQRILAKPHGTWTSGIYRLAVTGGDWHEGADIYRDYVAKALRQPDPPLYVKWLVDDWTTQDSNYAPIKGWDVICPTDRILMAANRQMIDGADSGYCGLYPYPCLAWGSVREFSQKLAVRRTLGGTYTPYHNFHLWSAGYGHYPRIGSFPKTRLPKGTPTPDDAWYKQAAAISYDGSYLRLETDPFAQLDMAMGSKEWREWLSYWTEQYLNWGADGMYYDQFNMIYGNGKLYPDFDTYGCWAPATLDLFSKMKKTARARDPYYTSSGEVCNDVYGQYVDLHMTSGVFNRLEFYRYCNPNQLIIDGGWNGGLAEIYGGLERRRFIWQVGARFEGFGDPQQLALRRAVKSLLYDAQFMDTVGVAVYDGQGKVLLPEFTFANGQNAPYRGVIGRWFLYTKGGQRGAVVNLINFPVRQDARISINTKAFGPVVAATAWTLDGKRFAVRGKQQGDVYTFPVPAAELSSVVLSNKLAPVVEWSLDTPAAAPGTTHKLAVKITNVSAKPITGTATLRLPAGWTATPVKFGPLAAGQSLDFTVPFTVTATAKAGRQDIFCNITTPDGAFSTYNFISVTSGPAIVDFRGNPGSYHIWVKNLTGQTLTGTAQCAAPASLQVSGPAIFTVPPEAEVELPVEVIGRDKLPEISEMRAHVTIGAQQFDVVRGVMPIISNGNFEVDSAKDMKPDWWMSRKLADEWSYEYLHLAEGAHSGKYCLLVDPPKAGDQFIRGYPVNGALKPNTRYRVSVWIKSESKNGVHVNAAGILLGNGKITPEWQQFTAEFTSGADNSLPIYGAYNLSNKPAYFDDLVVEEVK
ncbi:MAG: NEW3 domain-containing protein [Armatimonadota bacterium]